jgi:hypothetical protein
VKWIHGLLDVFWKEIVAEDHSVLLPELQHMDQQRQEMVEKDHNEAVKQYSNSVVDQATRKAYEARSELQWEIIHKQYETIMNSNSKRNALLITTHFPKILFKNISFPASIIAVNDVSFETEEIVIEALQLTLQRISDTVKYNDQTLLNEIRPKPRALKADDKIPEDGMLCMTKKDFMYFTVGKHPIQMIPRVEGNDEEFDPVPKYACLAGFPPKIQIVIPDGIGVRLNANSKHVSKKDQHSVANGRMKLLDDLTATESHITT